MAGWFYPPPPPLPTLVPAPPGTTAVGNQPPTPVGPGAAYTALRSTWPEESWPAQRSATIASQLATAWLNPASPTYPLPFYNAANGVLIRSAWPPELWPSQVLIGGGVGALTATVFTPPQAIAGSAASLRQIFSTWWGPESWPAQRGATIAAQFATVVNPPVFFPTPSAAVRMAILQSWPQEQWYAQSEGGIASGIAQIQVPPLYLPSSRVAQQALINATWPRDDWPAQWAGATAGAWFRLPVVAKPSPPAHFEAWLWPQEDWPAQRGARIAALFATAPQALPYINVSQRMALVAMWPPEQWAAQTGAIIAAQFAVPPPLLPFVNVPLQMILRSLWPSEQWTHQTQAPTAGIIATPFVPFVGVLVSTAVFQIVNAGLEVFIQYATSATVPPGYVISQSPAALTNLPTWTVVTITVSGGPAAPPGFASTPSVFGLFAKDATDALQTAMLSVNRYLWQVNSAPEGTVIAQSVAPFLIVPAGTLVQLTLSAGPVRVPPTTTVPLVH